MVRPVGYAAFPLIRRYIMNTRERLLFAIVLVIALTFLVYSKSLEPASVTPMFTAVIGYFFGASTGARRTDRRTTDKSKENGQ